MSNTLFEFFDQLGIENQTIEHPPLFTVGDSKAFEATIPGPITKNLFLKDDNKKFWLISALETTQLNLRKLAKELPAKNLRFAQADLLRDYLQVEPGSVTWFALFNDKKNQVNALLDNALFDYPLVGFHPLVNTATTVMKPQALTQFADALNHPYVIYDFKIE